MIVWNRLEFIKPLEIEGLPIELNGESFESNFGINNNLEVLAKHESSNANRYYYNYSISAVIDSSGRCISSKVKTNEHVLKNESNKIATKITIHLDKVVFKIESNPYGLSRWQYKTNIRIAQKPESLAYKELTKFKSRICELDTIDNIYVPKDLVESHLELDKELTKSDKMLIAEGEQSHMGLGMQIRNKWGLWKGSRLSCYFKNKGLSHPDHMSGIILNTYSMKLNNKEINEDSIISEAIRHIAKSKTETGMR